MRLLASVVAVLSYIKKKMATGLLSKYMLHELLDELDAIS